MTAFLFLFVFPRPIIVERCDLIEVNHFYDCRGRPCLRQVIFWHWYEDGYHVGDWRLLHCCAWPEKAEDGYRVIWRENGRLRCVQAPSYRETWTQYDPEIDDRRYLPRSQRVGLSRYP